MCGSDSATTAKSDPNCTTYTTAHSDVVGGSDYWDAINNKWSNTPPVSNTVDDMINRIDHVTTTTYYNTGDKK